MIESTLSPNSDFLQKGEIVLKTENVSVFYGEFLALRNVSLEIPQNTIFAFIGPSGCGKTTLLRCFNRTNDCIPGARVEGKINFYQQNLYADEVDAVSVRRRIGMVFQKPNPFPLSIYGNIAYGAAVNHYQGNMDELVERSLRRVVLWDEVKDRLKQSGLSLSGGQQQRLCIARAIAIEPSVVLMDEPCSALDPISTLKIEELMQELKEQYTIVIVTHNMQQAARMADFSAFFNAETTRGGKTGYLVEYNRTQLLFNGAKEEATRDYVSGRFG